MWLSAVEVGVKAREGCKHDEVEGKTPRYSICWNSTAVSAVVVEQALLHHLHLLSLSDAPSLSSNVSKRMSSCLTRLQA